MSHRVEPINAIIYAQYHLKGGLRNTVIGVAIAFMTVGGTCVMALSLDPLHRGEIARGASFILLALQWLALGIYGTSRVSAAVRYDVTSGILESHRLTPTPPLAAAIGYVLGAPLQAVALGAVLFTVGLGMCVVGGVPLTFWIAANLMTVAMSVTAWVLVALIAFTAGNGAAMPIVSALGILTATLFPIVPALAVLTAPLTGRSLFDFAQRGTPTLPPAYASTLVAQALIVGVLLLALARRYRNAATPAFSVLLAMVLMGSWLAITLVGIVQLELFLSSYLRSNGGQTRLIASVVSLMLVGLIPLVAIARRATRAPAERNGGRSLPAWLAVAACVAMATAPTCIKQATTFSLRNMPPSSTTTVVSVNNGVTSFYTIPWTRPPWRGLTDLTFRRVGTAAVIGSTFAGLALLLMSQYRVGRAGWVLPFLFVLLPNALPPLTDAAMTAAAEGPANLNAAESPYSTVTGFSPLGALIMLWDTHPRDATPGLIGQAALILLPAGLYLARRHLPLEADADPADRLTAPPPVRQDSPASRA